MSMQTLLVREHNRIASILSKLNPAWDDEVVFQETRRIVIAILQHITYSEYVPILLGENTARILGLLPAVGKQRVNVYNPNLDPRVSNEVFIYQI